MEEKLFAGKERGGEAVAHSARGYDRIAPMYDEMLAKNPVAVWMRQQLWQHMRRAFPPSARILDLSAGTGADAIFLAESGYRVIALDASKGMLEELDRRAVQRSLQIQTRVLPAECLANFDERNFYGVISTFAGLNTMQNLPALSFELARLLEPRGRVIFHALNQFCFWDAFHRLVRRRPARTCTMTIHLGGEQVPHALYRPLALYRSAFQREFELREVYALSVIAAPTWVQRARRLAPLVLRADRALGRVAPGAGDFFVMDLERR